MLGETSTFYIPLESCTSALLFLTQMACFGHGFLLRRGIQVCVDVNGRYAYTDATEKEDYGAYIYLSYRYAMQAYIFLTTGKQEMQV